MLTVSLDCRLLIVPSVVSNIYIIRNPDLKQLCIVINVLVPLLIEYDLFCYWLLRNYDGTQVSEPSKDKTMDEMEKISERFTNVVNIDGKSGLDLDGMDDDFVHVINATDTSNNKDKR